MKSWLLLLLLLVIHETYAFPCVINGGPHNNIKHPNANHSITSFVNSIDIMFNDTVTIVGYTINEVAATIEFTSDNNGLLIPQSAAINGNNLTLYTEAIIPDESSIHLMNPQTIFFSGDEGNVSAVYRPLELLPGSVNVGGIPLFYGQSVCTSWIDRLLPSISNMGIRADVEPFVSFQIMFNKPVITCSGAPVRVDSFFTGMNDFSGFPTNVTAVFETNQILPANGIVPNRVWYFATAAFWADPLYINSIAADKFCDVTGQANIGFNRSTAIYIGAERNYHIGNTRTSPFSHFTDGNTRNSFIQPYYSYLLDRNRDGYADAALLKFDVPMNITSINRLTFDFSSCTLTPLSNIMSIRSILPVGSNISDFVMLDLNGTATTFNTGAHYSCATIHVGSMIIKGDSSLAPFQTVTGDIEMKLVYGSLPAVILSAVYIPGLKKITITTNRVATNINTTTFRFLTSLSSHATYYNVTSISSNLFTYNVIMNDYIRGPVLSDSSTPLKAFITMRPFVTNRATKPYWKGVTLTESSSRFIMISAAFKYTNLTEIEITFAATGLLIESFDSTYLTINCNSVPISYSTVGLSKTNTTLVLYVHQSACANGLPMTIDMAAHTIVNAVAGNDGVTNTAIERIPVPNSIISSTDPYSLTTVTLVSISTVIGFALTLTILSLIPHIVISRL